jgi:hypothetical protein
MRRQNNPENTEYHAKSTTATLLQQVLFPSSLLLQSRVSREGTGKTGSTNDKYKIRNTKTNTVRVRHNLL